jgi:hypothetical protein
MSGVNDELCRERAVDVSDSCECVCLYGVKGGGAVEMG